MYKKSLLSYTATVAIILSSIYSNAHAESLEASGEGQSVIGETGKSYEILHAKESGKITGENLTVTGNKDTNKGPSEGGITPPPGSSSLESPAAVTAEGKNSMITLTGDKTTIKGTDSAIIVGVEAKDGGTISITGGSINASDFGALFWNNNNKESKLKDVTISSGKDDTPLNFGVKANKNGTVTLENVKVFQTVNAVVADNSSTITVSGGSFDAKEAAIATKNGSTITLTDNAQITSSDNAGLYAKGPDSTITMTGGNVTGKFAALSTKNGGHITITGGTLKTKGTKIDTPNDNSNYTDGFGAFSENTGSVIELENTIISDAKIGLSAKNGGAISMAGGSIKASVAGAVFVNSKSAENKLENVTISSIENGKLLDYGIQADQGSTVALKNVKVTQTHHAVNADNDSTITISGGSFETDGATIDAQNGSTVTLTDNAQITSSDNSGLYAYDNGTINMTGGNVTGKIAALGATTGGHITVIDVTLKTQGNGFGVFSKDSKSVIELENTTINNSVIGLKAENNGAISMTGGSIKASVAGAVFENSNSEKNKLENVTISNIENDKLLDYGIQADKGSTVALKNVTISQAINAVVADNSSTITVSGGSFNAELATIAALNGGTIILTDNAQITSSDNSGLYAHDNGVIKMTGGTVAGKIIALSAENSGHITITDGTLKTTDDGIGANADGSNSVIELENTTVSDSAIGLKAENNGAISMKGGSIKASQFGAVFSKSESEENYLDNVTISSGKNDAPLLAGIQADQGSTVALKNVKVTQTHHAVNADNDSTITISGGSFETDGATIDAQNGSTVTLTDNAQITSSDNSGLYAYDNGTINMTGGNVTGKIAALGTTTGGHITATDVTLKTTDGDGVGAGADGSDSVIKLLGNTTISDSNIGIGARNSGAISITGGSIKASQFGAYFENTKSEKNKLEGVTISSVKNDTPLLAGIAADKNSTVALKDVTVTNANTGISANDHSTITVSGGSVTAEGIALYATNGGQIDVTNVALTAEEGARADGTNSVIELHGKTTLKNASVGLSAIDGGKIASNESLTIIGREAIVAMSVAIGVWADNANSEINLNGKTTLEKVVTGLVASDGGKIFSKDITIIGADPKDNDTEERNNVGVKTNDIDSRVELKGKTIIEKVNVGLSAFDGSTIKLINVPANAQNSENSKIEAKEVALLVEGGGQIDVTNVSATAGIAGLQFVVISNPDPDESDDLEKHQSNAINLTNTKLSADNGAGIFITAFSDPDITENADLSIGKVNLTNSEIHADVLLGDGIFSKEDESWNNENVNIISNGTFTLSADQSILEGRANIAKNRNVHFDLKNNTQWILKNSAHETDDD
uniref:beta strand repeat-containing protein n=1 Tax=Bartonella sp. MF74HXZ TaxID=1461006 RepID=UPI0035D0E275